MGVEGGGELKGVRLRDQSNSDAHHAPSRWVGRSVCRPVGWPFGSTSTPTTIPPPPPTPPQVLDFSVEGFFKGLGYTAHQMGNDLIQTPAGAAAPGAGAGGKGRRLAGF